MNEKKFGPGCHVAEQGLASKTPSLGTPTLPLPNPAPLRLSRRRRRCRQIEESFDPAGHDRRER